MYKNAFLWGSSKTSNSFLSLCMLETVAITLFFTLPTLMKRNTNHQENYKQKGKLLILIRRGFR